MKEKSRLLVPLFELFINESYKGKRLKADGSKIKPQTIVNYEYVLRYLKEFECKTDSPIRIKELKGSNQRLFATEKRYWKKFYDQFTNFLYKDIGCFDNYAGTVIKIIRIFFNWIIREKGIAAGEFYKSFYICKEEIPIVTLMPEQLDFLINNKNFERKLSKSLMKSRSIFIFGCTVGLRNSDLFALKHTDVRKTGDKYYIVVKTIKTSTMVRIKLPQYAVEILQSFQQSARKRKTIFPNIPAYRFNNHIKEIGQLAGWTEVIGKTRSRRGVDIKQKREVVNTDRVLLQKEYRFCDLLSSHTMRRTAITTMLLMGMKEHLVKQISGHTGNSKSFYRYVNLVQPYMDQESEMVWGQFEKTANTSALKY